VEAVSDITSEAIGSSDVRLLVGSGTLATDIGGLAESAGSGSYGTGLAGILVGKEREESSRTHIALSVQKTGVAICDITENTFGVCSIGLEPSLALLTHSSS